MNIFKTLILSFAVTALMLIVSCSEDSSTQPTTTDYSDYYPLSVGSWWVYENWRTDENFVPDSLLSRDSTVIVSEMLFNGKMAKVRITFDTYSGEAIDTTYEYFENNTVYNWDQISPFSDEEGWVVRGDFTKNKITILDTNVTDATIEDIMIFSGNLKAEMIKGLNKSVMLKDMEYSALTYDMIIDMEGTVMVPGYGEYPFEMNATGNMYFVKNIGRVQILSVRSMEVFIVNETEYNKEILVDWNIK